MKDLNKVKKILGVRKNDLILLATYKKFNIEFDEFEEAVEWIKEEVMSLKHLEGKVNPNARRLTSTEEEVCKYCGKKAYYHLKFKTTEAFCCEMYHGDCDAIRQKALNAEKKYGKNYYNYQQKKREKWKNRNMTIEDIPDGILKI